MALKDNKKYIVDNPPANIHFVNQISKACPQAKFVRIVRDGRDVSLSQEKLGWINPPPPYRSKVDKLNYTLVAWGITNSKTLLETEKNVLTIRYENFLSDLEKGLATLSSFLDTESANYDLQTILNPTQPNSAFGRLGQDHNRSALARWKNIEPELVKEFTFGCHKSLKNFGYSNSKPSYSLKNMLRYTIFSIHFRLKNHLTKYHIFASRTSETLEINKK